MNAWLGRAWRRVFGCRLCHGTGVIMEPECNCNGPSSYEPCEAWCGTTLCPNRCKIAQSRDDASRVWRKYWVVVDGSWRRPRTPGRSRMVGYCADSEACKNHCGRGPCSRVCMVCLRLAWTDSVPCPACPDSKFRSLSRP